MTAILRALKDEANAEVRRATAMIGLTLLVLLALVALTCWASYQHLGPARASAGLGIAACKIALVAWFFMQLRHAQALIVVALLIAMATMSLLFGLSATDYAVRSPAKSDYQTPQQIAPFFTKGHR
ncbi:MAG: cytochrome C oxidase subunit IV family protein [Aquabacterium sp.]